MQWVRRANIHVDRAACARLIRCRIDVDAEFVFVTDPAEVPADATPFDMRGVELGHRGGGCSFETLLSHYGLTDPVLWRIAEASTKPTSRTSATTGPKHPASTSPLRGLSTIGDDEAVLAVTGPLIDGLYEFWRRGPLTGREPA